VPSPGRPNPPRHDPGDGFHAAPVQPVDQGRAPQALRRPPLTEDILHDSGLDWTVVRPPRLTDKPLTGTYRTAHGQNLRRGLLISRADVAHHMLHVLDQPETIKQVIGIAN
jgi:putative NADH-flavin reductase